MIARFRYLKIFRFKEFWVFQKVQKTIGFHEIFDKNSMIFKAIN